MYKERGLKRIKSASKSNNPVRFFVRDGFGRFSSLKFVLLLKSLDKYYLTGILCYVVHRGIVIGLDQEKDVSKSTVNWQTVKKFK